MNHELLKIWRKAVIYNFQGFQYITREKQNIYARSHFER